MSESPPELSAAEENAALRALLATLPGPVPSHARTRGSLPVVPFQPLPPLAPSARLAIADAALEANDRYLLSFIERHSICPFSRGGRAQGLTARFVHIADSADLQPFFDLMARAAADPSKAVFQVIVPMVQTSAEEWYRFCHEVTAAGHDHLREKTAGDDAEIFAVAPLHPELSFTTRNPLTLISLFRRAPDPTIQWVRLDALKALYRGRSGDTVCVDAADVPAYLSMPRRVPLFDRIAETNMKMALRLGIPEVEASLREIARSARAHYTEILLRDEPSAALAPARCPRGSEAPGPDASPPARPVLHCAGRWGLIRVLDLPPRTARWIVVEDVDLVVVRGDDAVHVLHGRCPHRFAPLSQAIVEADRLVCPHHGWDFRLDSGVSEGVPGERIHRFSSDVRDGLVWIDGEELRAWRRNYVPAFREEDCAP